jgi:predicted ATP-dependent protease
MPLIASRFLAEKDDVVDLATGERVRLIVEQGVSRAGISDRLHRCDRLVLLRHPLLAPLIDYGFDGARWFEAYETCPRDPRPRAGARASALHLVRFLRANDVELSSRMADRHIRPRGGPVTSRGVPLGIQLRSRSAIDAVRIALEGAGPAGVTRIAFGGPAGSGLRTARLVLARAARLVGYLVVDARLSSEVTEVARMRHCCVIDWLPKRCVLPALFGQPRVAVHARHLWLRMMRDPSGDDCAVALDPMSPPEMMAMIYRDAELGPREDEVRRAIHDSRGWPGVAVDGLVLAKGGHPTVGWVHETAPAYIPEPPAEARERGLPHRVTRLSRVLDAACEIALRGRHRRAERVLRRCAAALLAQGATAVAAAAWLALGDVCARRAHAADALAAYREAQQCGEARQLDVLLACGAALVQLDRLQEAEALFRTVRSAADSNRTEEASARLACLLIDRGDLDGAALALRSFAKSACASTRLARARLHRACGRVADALHEARTVAATEAQAALRGEAHVILVELYRGLADETRAREHAGAAAAAARTAADRGLRLVARAAACAVAAPPSRPGRILDAARHLPPGVAKRVRAFLSEPPRGVSVVQPEDPARTLETLLDLCTGAPDDARAAAAIAEHLRHELRAWSVALWTARDLRQVALAGRSWSDTSIVRLTINAGAGTYRDGAVVEAAEPILAGKATLGCITVRWPAGAGPGPDRARRLLRLSAAAVAPAMSVLNAPAPPPAQGSGFPDDLLGTGSYAESLRATIARAAVAPYPVLIEGESGSGKELVARAIHARSTRRHRRLCAVNCAAFTEDLLDAELFGHGRGAFTGAAMERQGLFEEADQGTLFLDEVAELSPRGQAKLLRALQEGEIRRVGENVARRVDPRIVAATNRPLEGEVEAGRFRADLRFRLDVIRIRVPPLRERPDEFPRLAERIWAEATARVGTRATLGFELVGALARYDWPGNVRELQNVLAALAVHAPPRGRVPVALLAPQIAAAATVPCVGFDVARL